MSLVFRESHLGLLRLEDTVELCWSDEQMEKSVTSPYRRALPPLAPPPRFLHHRALQYALVASMMLPLTLSLPLINAFWPLSLPSAMSTKVSSDVLTVTSALVPC